MAVTLCLQRWVNHDSDSHRGSELRETMGCVCTLGSVEVLVAVGLMEHTALRHEPCDHHQLRLPLLVLRFPEDYGVGATRLKEGKIEKGWGWGAAQGHAGRWGEVEKDGKAEALPLSSCAL